MEKNHFLEKHFSYIWSVNRNKIAEFIDLFSPEIKTDRVVSSIRRALKDSSSLKSLQLCSNAYALPKFHQFTVIETTNLQTRE